MKIQNKMNKIWNSNKNNNINYNNHKLVIVKWNILQYNKNIIIYNNVNSIIYYYYKMKIINSHKILLK